MNDEQLLLAQIIANPDDDTLRLVYADKLEENGKVQRAEFVRVQVELARLSDSDPKDLFISDWDRMNELRRLNQDMLKGDKSEPATGVKVKPEWFRRGFLERLELSAKDFLKVADRLVWHESMNKPCPLTAHPIRKVKLTSPLLSSMRQWRVTHHTGDEWESVLRKEFPGVEFELSELMPI